MNPWDDVEIHENKCPMWENIRLNKIENDWADRVLEENVRKILQSTAKNSLIDILNKKINSSEFPDEPDHSPIPEKPLEPKYITEPESTPKPIRSSFRKKIPLWRFFIPWSIKYIRDSEMHRFHIQLSDYDNQRYLLEEIKKKNRKIRDIYNMNLSEWENKMQSFKEEYDSALYFYNLDKEDYHGQKNDDIGKVKKLSEDYDQDHPDGIVEYILFGLNLSEIPVSFRGSLEGAFDKNNGAFVLDIGLPNLIDDIKIVKRKKEGAFDFIEIGERDILKIRKIAIYSIVLRRAYEICKLDRKNIIKNIIINGKLSYIDRSTGKRATSYIITMHSTPSFLLDLELEDVDPQECFRALKGIAAPGLETARPSEVRQIMQINKDDGRIIEGRAVINELNTETNLATLDWDDFEHLIRELFEKEFSNFGADVKITRASRDLGVDAIVFDPDPIRGGKFVIQAKRYTNVVDVSAVRDLYGTLLSEGANRGILVTTSHFGSESYEWAKGKPLSLVDGQNLLRMLQKHGHNYRINIQEAKDILKSLK